MASRYDLDSVAGILESLQLVIKGMESSSSKCDQEGDAQDLIINKEGDEVDLVISDSDSDDDDGIGAMLASLFPSPPKKEKSASTGFDFDAIMKHICNCAKHHKRTKADIFRDIFRMVSIGVKRGNIKRDQLVRTDPRGAKIIREVAFRYNIPIKSTAGERIQMQEDTLTFVRAISCFPHLASLLLYKKPGTARNGVQSVLASDQLPDAMKHSGFAGLIPKGCDLYLKKAYLFAHTAYMVDFGNLINRGNGKSLKSMASTQLNYSKVHVEKFPLSDEFRAGVLRSVRLTDPDVFKKIVDVCNNLCREVGKPELSFATAEKDHIKNNMICFFEDDCKDVADDEVTKMTTDMLSSASINDTSTSTD